MHKISNNLYSHISKLFVIADQIDSHKTKYNKKLLFASSAHISSKKIITLLQIMVQSYEIKSQNQLKKTLSLNSRKN